MVIFGLAFVLLAGLKLLGKARRGMRWTRFIPSGYVLLLLLTCVRVADHVPLVRAPTVSPSQ